ncbi:DNA polymerase IV [Mycobacteroides abscessus subsp. abscessus]|nr:Putative DNA-directed DNA polymerase [Mycobacteroides abscessus]SHU17269.1 DNA polymerase IV [Mycobacteroides abscessus subsp. abscessus]CPZ52577.1 Putative DNA-directed DNA polymerase [Mycobacteroides abscessus]CQA10365.1 Putative DNA-directed DNA polymerase [Mycobacteroides abscessus]SHW92896.1 DNA polymerase IV [Mycobacteroides abscessus subsp. abscessus]
MTGTASILHADLDSFYASVEQRDAPALRDRPVIVGGGVVLAASYEAKHCGVRTAMGGRQALRLCPHAVVVPPRFDAYTAASKLVFEVFRDTTPLVEPLSIDEAFLDVSGLQRISGAPSDIAATLRLEVRRRAGLPITVGIARTKFLAKVASRQGKPDGLLVVEPHEELSFLRPLPVQALWGVGSVTAEKLRVYGIRTVADVADLGESTLASMVGRAMGHQLHCLANNIDPRRVDGVGARSVRSARLAAGHERTARSMPSQHNSWSRLPAACAAPAAAVARWCYDCVSATTPAPRAHAPCRDPPRPPNASCQWPASLSKTPARSSKNGASL